MKKNIFLILIIIVVLGLSGCKPEDPNDNPGTTYSIDDFYEQIVLYEQKFAELTEDAPEMNYVHFSPQLSFVVDGTKKITRDQFMSNRDSSFNKVYDDYYESLITTEMFVQGIKQLIEDSEDIKLDEEFQVEEIDMTYRFVLSERGYVLIETIGEHTQAYLKMGLDDGLLEYSEFHYYFHSGSIFPGDDPGMNFNYFTFTEDKVAVQVNYSPESSSLRYTSIVEDEQFTISQGEGVVEGPEQDEVGYVLNMYDRDLDTQSYLQVVNGDIIGETYDVFDEYGQVYRYDNYENLESSVQLQINVVSATGWDYAIVPTNGVNDEIREVMGVYDTEDSQLYGGRLNYNDSPGNAFLGIWLEFEDPSQITDEVFSLSGLGMELDHPKANVAFLNQIKKDNFNDVKSTFQIEGLDFFAQDLHQELYSYVDLDIRNDLEGNNEEPVITEGDIEEYESAMARFGANFQNNPNYEFNDTSVVELKDDGTVVSTASSGVYSIFNLEAMFFEYRSILYGSNDNQTYVLDGSKGNIMEYIIEGQAVKYSVLQDEATQESFMQHYQDFMGESDTSGVKNITKINETTFELEVTTRYFSTNGVDIVKLFQQQGITGLEDQTIVITIEFYDDFMGYEAGYEMSGLEASIEGTNYDVTISSTTTMELTDDFNMLSPIDSTFYSFYLAKEMDDVIFFLEPGNDRFYVDRGDAYIGVDATEIGDYDIQITGSFTSMYDFQVFDEDGNPVDTLGDVFTSTYIGKYYIKINARANDNVDVRIWYRPSKQYTIVPLDSFDSTVTFYVEEGDVNLHQLVIPSSPVDRVLRINRVIGGENEHVGGYIWDPFAIEIGFNLMSCDMHEIYLDCIFFIPKDTEYNLSVMGHESFELTLNYSYLEINDEFTHEDITLDHYTDDFVTWYNVEDLEAIVHFTIDEDGQYMLNSDFNQFGEGYVDAWLYRSNGDYVTDEWRHVINLTAGDYYIRYTFKDGLGYDEFATIIIGKINKVELG